MPDDICTLSKSRPTYIDRGMGMERGCWKAWYRGRPNAYGYGMSMTDAKGDLNWRYSPPEKEPI